MIFADTSALLALINKNDKFHKSAVSFLATKPDIVSSSWVIEEFIAHLHARYGLSAAKKGSVFISNIPGLKIEYLSNDLLSKTFNLFNKHGSLRISIVDISNVVIIKKLGIEKIFCFDKRFSSIFDLTINP